MQDKQVNVNVSEISELENLKYLLEDSLEDFKDLNQDKDIQNKIKEMANNPNELFYLYLIIHRSRNTHSLLEKICDKYYEGNEIEVKIKAQEQMTDRDNCPLFAPDDGVCFNCGNQIYNYITLKEASTELITGCPICGRTYCD